MKVIKKFKVTHDHQVYKSLDYDTVQRELKEEIWISAFDLEEAKSKLKEEHNLNPFYFKFEEEYSIKVF